MPRLLAQELSFNFSQDGYAEGATVTGTFSGTDLDHNRALFYFPLHGSVPSVEIIELSTFSLHFSGNSLVPPLDLTIDDLIGFTYQISSPNLGDKSIFLPAINGDAPEGIAAFGADYTYTSGIGPNLSIGGIRGGPLDVDDLDNLNSADLVANALDSSPNVIRVPSVPEPPTICLASVAGLIAGIVYHTKTKKRKPNS
ncbi:MAG TPA: hypothetical protein VGM76_03080 [Lacipirellulaceae bacterium]|jgi:hypothetical protein